MKLNNKGFAITSILYGLLVLFVILVGSYLTILSSQKNRYDILAEDIDETFGFNECVYKNSSENCEDTLIDIASLVPYRAEYTGKYNFIVNGAECFSYLYEGNTIDSTSSLKCYTDDLTLVSGNNVFLKQIYY